MSGTTQRYTVETEFVAIDAVSKVLKKMGADSELFKNAVGVQLLKQQEKWTALGEKIKQVGAAIHFPLLKGWGKF